MLDYNLHQAAEYYNIPLPDAMDMLADYAAPIYGIPRMMDLGAFIKDAATALSTTTDEIEAQLDAWVWLAMAAEAEKRPTTALLRDAMDDPVDNGEVIETSTNNNIFTWTVFPTDKAVTCNIRFSPGPAFETDPANWQAGIFYDNTNVARIELEYVGPADSKHHTVTVDIYSLLNRSLNRHFYLDHYDP